MLISAFELGRAGLRHVRTVRPNRAADFRGGRLFER